MSSVRFRCLDREQTLAELRALAARTGREHREVQAIYLFGSLARGERNPYADADLLVVLDSSDVPVRDRAPQYKPVDAPVPLDLLVCTRVELDREIAAKNPFVCRILGESLLLHASSAAR